MAASKQCQWVVVGSGRAGHIGVQCGNRSWDSYCHLHRQFADICPCCGRWMHEDQKESDLVPGVPICKYCQQDEDNGYAPMPDKWLLGPADDLEPGTYRCLNCGLSLGDEPALIQLGFCNSECKREYKERQ